MPSTLTSDIARIRAHVTRDFRAMYREPGGKLNHPFLVPGSDQYAQQLWDWDSWTANVALRQVFAEIGDPAVLDEARRYERGCIENFLSCTGGVGFIPICLGRDGFAWPADVLAVNMHKPCLAQHAAFLVREDGGDAEWLREKFYPLQAFINFYHNHHRHAATGLYYWQNDDAIGVDNDPATYGRPPKSSASFYLNALMYRELLAVAYLADRLGQPEIGEAYRRDAAALKAAIQRWCWDERDGFFYSVDLNIHANPKTTSWGSNWGLHDGYPCDWPCLIQRLDVWTGFLGLWAELAEPAQAERVVQAHYRNPRTFNCAFGVRTLSPLEKMYNVRAMGNPSSWLGPVWGIANYLTFRGLVKYGFEADARELAEKSIRLFGRDLERFGALHEYYLPDSGEPVLNRGFSNWNFLVLNMIAWLEGKPVVAEY